MQKNKYNPTWCNGTLNLNGPKFSLQRHWSLCALLVTINLPLKKSNWLGSGTHVNCQRQLPQQITCSFFSHENCWTFKSSKYIGKLDTVMIECVLKLNPPNFNQFQFLDPSISLFLCESMQLVKHVTLWYPNLSANAIESVRGPQVRCNTAPIPNVLPEGRCHASLFNLMTKICFISIDHVQIAMSVTLFKQSENAS